MIGMLEGVCVLSLAEQFPGPYATLLLADLGADVILVERPSGGDPARAFPEFFEALNRNKRSIALNLKSDTGRDAFMRCASQADAIIEGFRPGVAERLGVDYTSVCEHNPNIVYVSISGFGQDSPLRDVPAHDVSYQAFSGLLAEQVRRVGDLPSPPAVAVADLSAGMFGALGVLVGLFRRSVHQVGTYVDCSMADGLLSWMTPNLFSAANNLRRPGIPPSGPGYGIFETMDGRLVSVSVAHEDHFWRRLCRAIGMEHEEDLDGPERRERAEELRVEIESRIRRLRFDDAHETFLRTGVPFAPVHSSEDLVDHPHVESRGLLAEVPPANGESGRVHVRQPLTFDGYDSDIRRPCPELGQHTRDVLDEVGMEGERIDEVLTVNPIERPEM